MPDSFIWLPPTQAETMRAAMNSAHDGAGLAGVAFKLVGEGDLRIYVVPTGASVDSVTPINNTFKCPGAPGCPS